MKIRLNLILCQVVLISKCNSAYKTVTTIIVQIINISDRPSKIVSYHYSSILQYTVLVYLDFYSKHINNC